MVEPARNAVQPDERTSEQVSIQCGDTDAPKKQEECSNTGGTSTPYYIFGSSRMIGMVLGTLLLAWAFCWLYVGASWDPQGHTGNMAVAVLNCDYGVPAAVQQQLPAPLRPLAAQLAAQPLGAQLLAGSVWNSSSPISSKLNWQNYTCAALTPADNSSSQPGCTPAAQAACLAQLQQDVLDGHMWAAIFLPGNTSTSYITSAIGTNTSAALKQLTLTYYLASGRQLSTYSFITAIVRALVQGVALQIGSTMASTPQLAASVNPYFYLQPLQLVTADLAPVTCFGQSFACYITTLVVWIAAAMAVAVMFEFKTAAEARHLAGGDSPSRRETTAAVAARAAASCLTMFLASLLMLSVVLILGGSSAQFAGASAGYALAFVWYASLAFLAISALFINFIGPARFMALSTLMVILQLASCEAVFGHELSPGFFRVGYGLPFYWVVKGLRSIFFGTQMGLIWQCWLVLTAWNVVCVAAAVAVNWRKSTGKLSWPGAKFDVLALQGK